MKLLKKEEFESGQVIEFECIGETYDGVIEVTSEFYCICQNVLSGRNEGDKHGYRYSYVFDKNLPQLQIDLRFKNIRLKDPAPASKPTRQKPVVERIKPIMIKDGVEFKKNSIGEYELERHKEELAEAQERVNTLKKYLRWHKAFDDRGELD